MAEERAMDDATVDRRELLDRIAVLRHQIREDIGVAALMVSPTKACARSVSGLLDSLNGLAAILSVRRRGRPKRPPAQQNKLGAPLEHDWDDYKQKFLQLWQEKGDFQLPQNQIKGWNSQAAAAKRLLDYIQTRCVDGEEPHQKTVEGYISNWAKELRAAAERN